MLNDQSPKVRNIFPLGNDEIVLAPERNEYRACRLTLIKSLI